MPFLRQRAEGFAEQPQHRRFDRQLAGAGAEHRTRDTHEVTDVERFLEQRHRSGPARERRRLSRNTVVTSRGRLERTSPWSFLTLPYWRRQTAHATSPRYESGKNHSDRLARLPLAEQQAFAYEPGSVRFLLP